jgi:subtilisin family serine protease
MTFNPVLDPVLDPRHATLDALLQETWEQATDLIRQRLSDFISSFADHDLAPQGWGSINPSEGLSASLESLPAPMQAPVQDSISLAAIALPQDAVALNLNGQYLAPQSTPSTSPAFDLIGLTQLRNDHRFVGLNGSGFSVAVIDTGLDSTHRLLQGNYVTGYNFVNNTTIPTDYMGHGTHVAGIVGATDPNVGVATGAGLIGLQVFGTNSLSSNTAIERALQWVHTNRERYNIVAVNMSLGSGAYRSKTELANNIFADDILRLEQVGIPVVAAAGNAYATYPYQNLGNPGILSTIAVGAVWQDGAVPSYWWGGGSIDYSTGADRIPAMSQRMDVPNMLFAPGALITSTVPGNRLEPMGGTSMAAPMVSGAIALLQDAATRFGGRRLATEEILDILRTSADLIFDGDDEDDSVVNTNTTYRRINVYNAVETLYQRLVGTQEQDKEKDSLRSNNTIWGSSGDDTLFGSAGDDRLLGRGGNDVLYGERGNDVLKGGAGNDVLFGGGGDDTLHAGKGRNTLRGGGGNDVLIGGPKRDRLFGNRGNDILRGGGGRNLLVGGAGQDTFVLERGGTQTVRDFEAGIDQIKLRGGVRRRDLSFTQMGDRTLVHAGAETLGIFLGVTTADLGFA